MQKLSPIAINEIQCDEDTPRMKNKSQNKQMNWKNDSLSKFEIIIEAKELPEIEKQLFTLNQAKGNNLLPLTVKFQKNQVFLNETLYYQLEIYQQSLPTLRQEIQSRIQAQQEFSLNEIRLIFEQIEKCLQCLYSLNLAPTHINIDNICYFPQENGIKQWTLNMENFFKKYEAKKNFSELYFSQSLCKQLLSKNNNQIDLTQISLSQMQIENYFGLGISLLQACSLSYNTALISQYQNSALKTVQTATCYSWLKFIFEKYQSIILTNLLKFLIFTPKICLQQQNSFLYKLPITWKMKKIEKSICQNQFKKALDNIDEVLVENSKLLSSEEKQKLHILKFACLIKQEQYEQFLEQSTQLKEEIINKVSKQEIKYNDMIFVLKIALKQLQIYEKKQSPQNLEKILNDLLNLSNYYFAMQEGKLIIGKQLASNIQTEEVLLHNYLLILKQITQSNSFLSKKIEFLTPLLGILANYCVQLIQSLSSFEKTSNFEGILIILKEIQNQISIVKSLNQNSQTNTPLNSSTRKKRKINQKHIKQYNLKSLPNPKNTSTLEHVDKPESTEQFLNCIKKQICS